MVRFPCLCLVFGILASVAAAEPATIFGVVVSPSGEAVPGATVLLVSSGSTHPARSLTGATGGFVLPRPGTGGAVVWAHAAGFAPGRADVADGSLTVRLYSGSAVEGVVARAVVAQPLVGARVQAQRIPLQNPTYPAWIADNPFPVEATTDALGRFRLDGLYSLETYTLRTTAPGCAPDIQTLNLGETRPLRVALVPEGSIHGWVVDASSGCPVTGATVEIARPRWGTLSLTTDATGCFRLAGLGNETLELTPRVPGCFSTQRHAQRVRSFAGRDIACPTLEIEPGFVPILRLHDKKTGQPILSGVAEFEEGFPEIACERIGYGGQAFAAVQLRGATTALPLLPRWAPPCIATASGYMHTTVRLAPANRKATTAEIDVSLPPARKIHVYVASSTGVPLEGATVRRNASNGLLDLLQTLPRDVIASSTGYACLPYPDYYDTLYLAVGSRGYVSVSLNRAIPKGDRDHTERVVLSPMPPLVGRVRTVDSSPIADTTVTLSSHEGGSRFVVSATLPVGADGTWRCEPDALPWFGFNLQAHAPGLLSDVVSFTAKGPVEGAMQAPDLLLYRPLTFAGHILEEGTDHPVPGMQIQFNTWHPDATATLTNAAGAFRFAGLKRGYYQLEVAYPDEMPPTEGFVLKHETSRSVELSDHDVIDYVLRAVRGVAVEGQVLDAHSGAPLAGAGVGASADAPSRRPGEARYSCDTRTDAAGRFRVFVPSLVTEAEIGASTTGYLHANRSIAIPADLSPVKDIVFALELGGRIEGQVLDATGDSVGYPRVRYRKRNPTGSAGSPADVHGLTAGGTFLIDALDAGTWELHADTGYRYTNYPFDLPGASVEVRLAAGEQVSGIVLRLPPPLDVPVFTGTLTGEVHDENDKPRAGIRVELNGQDDQPEPVRQVIARQGSAVSDEKGQFTMNGLPPGRYRAIAREMNAKWNWQVRREVVVEDVAVPGQGLVLKLPGFTGIKGRVVDSSGRPVPEFVYALTEEGSPIPSEQGGSEDANSAFEIVPVEPGRYVLIVVSTQNGHGQSQVLPVVAGSILSDVVITTHPGADLVVVVRDSSRRAVEGLEVVVDGESPAGKLWEGMSQDTQKTDARGCAHFSSLPAGRYAVAARRERESGRPIFKLFEMVAGQAQTVELTVPGLGTVAGSTTNSHGQPVAGAIISWQGGSVRTGQDGRYRLAEMPEGEAEISVAWPEPSQGVKEQRKIRVEVGETAIADFALPACSVRGRVVFRGAAPAKVQVEASAKTSEGEQHVETTPDERGHFVLPGVPAGKVSIAARAEGWYEGRGYANPLAQQDIELKEGESREIELVVPGGSIQGEVVFEGEVPSYSSSPDVRLHRDEPKLDVRARLGSDRRFRFDGLPAGKYLATADDFHLAPGRAEVVLGQDEVKRDVRIVISKGATIRGKVHGAPPGSEVGVWADRPDSEYPAWDQAKPDGEYSLFPLGPGRHAVIAMAEGLASPVREIDVRENEIVELELQLQPRIHVELKLEGPDGAVPKMVPYGIREETRFFSGKGENWKQDDGGTVRFLAGPYAYTWAIHAEGYAEVVYPLDLTGEAPGSRVQRTVRLQPLKR